MDLIETVHALFDAGFGEDEIMDVVMAVGRERASLDDTQESQPLPNEENDAQE